jgi:hypothetical protein
VLDANLENLKKIYQSFFSPIKKWATMRDLIDVCMRNEQLGLSEN